MSAKARTVFYAAGAVLAVTGITFTGMQLAMQWGELEPALLGSGFFLMTSACAIIYALASVPLALAWGHLLHHFGSHVPLAVAVGVYGITVPAKYIPGNIFHLAGRQATGMARGIDGWSLARASFYELLLICLTGFFCSALMLTRFFPGASLMTATAFFVSSAGCLSVAIGKFLGQRVLYAFLEQLAFLVCSAAIFVALIVFVSGNSSLDPTQASEIGGAFILAWTIGLLTPGAPAGAGVREVVLLASLGGIVGDGDLLLAVVLSRFVTVAGDIVFFLLAALLGKQETEM